MRLFLLPFLFFLGFSANVTMADGTDSNVEPVNGNETSIYAGDGATSSLEALLDSVDVGSIVVFGEIHGTPDHHANQVTLLNALKDRGLAASVGMEFIDYTKQEELNLYLKKETSEDDFLESINWGSISFDHYREQVWFPIENNGHTYGINAPRTLTSKVAKQGLDSLTEDERNLLPLDFTLGQEIYFERFKEVMDSQHPMPENVLRRYFAAQSIWDDTMAWQSISNADQADVFVIIVGDFHAAYKIGLPHRLEERGHDKVVVISQIDRTGLSEEEFESKLYPHKKWGERADWIWVSK